MAQDDILFNKLTDDILKATQIFSRQMVSTGLFAFRSAAPIFNDDLQFEFQINDQGEEIGIAHVSVNSQNIIVFERVAQEVLNAMLTDTFNNAIGVLSRKPQQLNRTIRDHYTEEFGAISEETLRLADGMVVTCEQQILESMNADALFSNIMSPAIDGMISDMNERATVDALVKNAQHRIEDRFDNYLRPLATAQLQVCARSIEELYAKDLSLDWVAYVRRSDLPPERREFCNDHESLFAGNPRNYYHIREVQMLWPQYEGGEWEGQIPGTNKETILNFAGGYNCLHSFNYVDVTQVSEQDRAAARRELRAIGIRIA